MKIILMGPPGAGKGTISNLLAEKWNVPAISTGAILRSEIKKQTDLGKLAGRLINKGEFVPDETIVAIVKNTIKTMDGFLLDGFPRNVNQAHIFKTMSEVDHVLLLEADHDTIIERLKHRLVCSTCEATYHQINISPKNEGVCDRCQSPLKRREDDDPKFVAKRLNIYKEQTAPMIEFYEKEGLLVRIDANQDIEKIMDLVSNFRLKADSYKEECFWNTNA